MSSGENSAKPRGTFPGEINAALAYAIEKDPNLVIGGQMVKYGVAGLTTGLDPSRFITYSVSEALMNSSAMGLALAGKRVVMIHVRMDFITCGMDALVNHIPVWALKGCRMPITLICQVGVRGGQGPQHSKDLSPWFNRLEGWRVVRPRAEDAYDELVRSIFMDQPTVYVWHRVPFDPKMPETVRFCGTSKRHEAEFHGD